MMRESLFVAVAGVIGFGLFYGISSVQAMLGSAVTMSRETNESFFEKILNSQLNSVLQGDSAIDEIASGGYMSQMLGKAGGNTAALSKMSAGSKKALTKQVMSMMGGGMDPSKLSASNKKALLAKARSVLGNDFDPSKLSKSQKQKLMKKVRNHFR